MKPIYTYSSAYAVKSRNRLELVVEITIHKSEKQTHLLAVGQRDQIHDWFVCLFQGL